MHSFFTMTLDGANCHLHALISEKAVPIPWLALLRHWSVRRGEPKNFCLYPGIEPRLRGFPARSRVSIHINTAPNQAVFFIQQQTYLNI